MRRMGVVRNGNLWGVAAQVLRPLMYYKESGATGSRELISTYTNQRGSLPPLLGNSQDPSLKISMPWMYDSKGLHEVVATMFGLETGPTQVDAVAVYDRVYAWQETLWQAGSSAVDHGFLTLALDSENDLGVKEYRSAMPSGLTISAGDGQSDVACDFEAISCIPSFDSDSGALQQVNTENILKALAYTGQCQNYAQFHHALLLINEQDEAALDTTNFTEDVMQISQFSISIQRKFRTIFRSKENRADLRAYEPAEPAPEGGPEISLSITIPTGEQGTSELLRQCREGISQKAELYLFGENILSDGNDAHRYHWRFTFPGLKSRNVPAETDGRTWTGPKSFEFEAHGVYTAPTGMTITQPIGVTSRSGNDDASYFA